MQAYERIKTSKLYQLFRVEGYPTHYNDNKIGAPLDLHSAAIFIIFSSLFIALLLILPGFRGKERIYAFIRYTLSLLIGLTIILCNFELAWESSEIRVKTLYKAGSSDHVNATIGLQIGLRGINITFKGIPEKQLNQIINYNEHFSWEWDQGKFGFGTQAGKFHQEFRSAQVKGLPYPILWVAEYLTIDGEGFRFGRLYRTSGWVSFSLWILSNILFFMVIQYGALFLILNGTILLTCNLLFVILKNPIPLKIPFELLETNETGFLEPHYSWCFHLNIINGIFCIFLGVISFLSDVIHPDETALFFGIDVLKSYDDYYEEIHAYISNANGKEKSQPNVEETSFIKERDNEKVYIGLKRRSILSNNRFSRIHMKPATQPRVLLRNNQDEDLYNTELPHYENFRRFESIGEEQEEGRT